MKKIVIFLFLLVLVISILGYFYLYKNHRDVSTTDAVRSVSSKELLDVFQDSDIENDKEFLDQVIEISGLATSHSASTLTLDKKIFVEFDRSMDNTLKYIFKSNEEYTIKGRCMGYDDLLEEVKIDQARIINTPK